MNKSVYDVLYAPPRLHRRLSRKAEKLAQAIFASGKIRLSAEFESNFQRLQIPEHGINITFTMRELFDPVLVQRSHARLVALLSKRRDAQTAATLASGHLDRLRADAKKRSHPSEKTELMMARAFVLCNEDAVIRLIHLEGAEIYISFGHSVGDMMDVVRWQEVGANSGLQSVGPGENAVYVSCGGNPFLEEEEYLYTTDGPAALARFMIIAAQETGHNGDMIRSETGQWVGRHSAIHWGRAPSKKAGAGRLADIVRTQKLFDICQKFGLHRIARFEYNLKFYRDKKLGGARRVLAWFVAKTSWVIFKLLLRLRGVRPIVTLQRDKYPATLLRTFFIDQLANLTPDADVYRRKNASEEEAVACIEAVARIPQQVVKWGHKAVRFSTPALYDIYYNDIVPACEQTVARIMRA